MHTDTHWLKKGKTQHTGLLVFWPLWAGTTVYALLKDNSAHLIIISQICHMPPGKVLYSVYMYTGQILPLTLPRFGEIFKIQLFEISIAVNMKAGECAHRRVQCFLEFALNITAGDCQNRPISIVFPSWHLLQPILCIWLLCFILRYLYSLFVLTYSPSRVQCMSKKHLCMLSLLLR